MVPPKRDEPPNDPRRGRLDAGVQYAGLSVVASERVIRAYEGTMALKLARELRPDLARYVA
jgi:hypothetical protein